MIVESGLPIEIYSQTMGMFRYSRFVGTDNGRNGFFALILESALASG
jgi:hypothetical protein